MKGVYCLILYLKKNRKITVGKQVIAFTEGYYCYVGSALNNLEKRIERHKRNEKKKRWHIDYFLEHAQIVGVKKIVTDKRIECKLSKKIKRIADGSVKDFGSSDCRCESHLYYFRRNPLKSRGFVNIFMSC